MSDKSFLHKDEQDLGQLKRYQMGNVKAFFFLMRYAKPYLWGSLSGLFLIALSSAVIIKSSELMGVMVEEALIPKDWNQGILLSSIIIGLELMAIFLTWAGGKLLAEKASLVIFDIRKDLFQKANALPMTFYDHQPQGRVVTRMTHDIEGLENFFVGSLQKISRSILVIILSFYAILSTDLHVGALIILSLIPVVIFIYFTKEKLRKINRDMSLTSSQLNSKLSEFIDGIEVIRSFGLESWSKEKYGNNIGAYLNSVLSANTFYALINPTLTFLIYAPFFILIWFGGQKVLAGALSVGVFVSLMRYCERFFNPIMTLAREVQVIQQALTNGERVASFLKHHEEDLVLGENGKLTPAFKGHLEYRNVTMGYDQNSPVLKGLSFTIAPGQLVGLVGKTGCGKTSTVSLLSRLYEFQKGEIYIDGVNIRDIDRDYLRSQIGFVSQDVIVFRDTIRNNLLLEGRTQFNDESLLKACALTGFDQVLKRAPEGLDTVLTESGSNLSLGEKQILAFTRVVLSDPKVLILDEATASIDPESERLIQSCVEKVLKGRSCLLIAHRLDTLQNCDRILVFDKGQLIEDGSPENLLNQKGAFYRLRGDDSHAKLPKEVL